MFNKIIPIKHIVFVALFTILAVFVVAACQPVAPATSESEPEHMDDHEHEEEEETTERVPNDGSVVHIVSPTEGASFKTGEDIVVEIETENFDLSAEGNHWHVYVDGKVLTMIAGGIDKTVIHGLEPGDHEVEVYLGLPTHEELEDGDSIMISVTE